MELEAPVVVSDAYVHRLVSVRVFLHGYESWGGASVERNQRFVRSSVAFALFSVYALSCACAGVPRACPPLLQCPSSVYDPWFPRCRLSVGVLPDS